MGEDSVFVVELTEADIPGATLNEPLERHAIPELKWWLLCHGICAPASIKKQQLLDRYCLNLNVYTIFL